MRKPDPALVVRSAVLAAVTLMGLATAACRPARLVTISRLSL